VIYREETKREKVCARQRLGRSAINKLLSQ
jgi:hypothetical protein